MGRVACPGHGHVAGDVGDERGLADPRDGRRSTMRLLRCRPDRRRSTSSNPVGIPGERAASRCAACSRAFMLSSTRSRIGTTWFLLVVPGHRVDQPFGLVGRLAGIVGHLVGVGHDPGGRLDQPAQQRVLGDDLRVVRGAGRAGHLLDQAVEVQRAAHQVQVLPALELLADGDQVHGLSASVDGEHGLVRLLMGRPVEVPGLDAPRAPQRTPRGRASWSRAPTARPPGCGAGCGRLPPDRPPRRSSTPMPPRRGRSLTGGHPPHAGRDLHDLWETGGGRWDKQTSAQRGGVGRTFLANSRGTGRLERTFDILADDTDTGRGAAFRGRRASPPRCL